MALPLLLTLSLALVGALAAPCAPPPPPPPPHTAHRPAAFAGSFFVSPLGNDSWSGTLPSPSGDGLDGPFASPAAAAAAVVALPRPLAADVRVQLRAATYHLNATLALGPGSGGDSAAALVVWTTYAADAPAAAVLSGGARVSGWAPAAARPGAFAAPLPPAAPARSRGLFVGGARRWPARVPPAAGPARSDFASDASTLHYNSSLDGCGFAPAECWPQCSAPSHALNAFGFVYDAADPRSPSPSWADIPGIDVLTFGSWTAAWAPVAAVFSANATLLTAAPLSSARPGDFGGRGCPSGARYILFNVAEALSTPGGFYVDDTARVIYYSPLPGEDPTSASFEAVVPVLETVVRVQGDDCGGPVASLAFEGLGVAHASDGGTRAGAYYAPSAAVELASARDVALIGVNVSACDGTGIGLGQALLRVSLSRVGVRDVGGNGVGVSGSGDANPVNTTISDCTVDGAGGIFLSQPSGVFVQGDASGVVVVEHNLVRDTTYAGIMVGWIPGGPVVAGAPWQFIVRGNVVESIGNSILSDFGGIYVSIGGQDSGTCEPGGTCFLPTLVEGNLVRNVRGYNYGGEGVYTDENVAGVAVIGNALGNVSGASLYLHCGVDQVVTNNVVWGNGQPSGPAYHGSGGLVGSCNTGGVDPQYTNVSALVDRNIFLLTQPSTGLFNNGSLDWLNMTFSRNVYWAVPPLRADALRWPDAQNDVDLTWAQWQAAGQDASGAVADPLVASADSSDFTLLPGSPALALGFQQLNQTWGPRA